MQRVTMLDFGVEPSNETGMARPRTLAWPVMAYRITLPGTYGAVGDSLNPFEKVVLTFLKTGGFTSEERLAKETCIPEDFVKGVLLRLQDKGYIDDQMHPIDSGYSATNKSDYPTFRPAMLFRELVGGNVMPYILYDTQPKVKLETTGLYCRKMRYDDQRFEPITAKDVIEALKDQKRHERAYGEKTNIPKVNSITISATNEMYYLECPIGLRTVDGEFRISNPFGKGYSFVLEDVFMQQLDEDDKLLDWMESWRKSLAIESSPEAEKAAREPFETEENKQLYPRLIASLKPNKDGIRSIEKIYSSLEWALFYSNERLGSRNVLNLLKLTSSSDSLDLQERAAIDLGLSLPSKGFSQIREINLESYEDGIPEMPTAFAIALLQAQADRSHPLRAYSKGNPDAAERLYSIKTERDIKSHGKGRGSTGEHCLRNESFMKEFVSALLPEIHFSEEDTAGQTVSNVLIDARFRARNSLLFDVFGYKPFNTELKDITQERLVDAEGFWMSFSEGDNALQFVGDLYAALQCELSSRIETAGFSAVSDDKLSELIRERSRALRIEPLPKALSTVRMNNIRKAMQGHPKTTLGGVAVAYLICNEQDKVERLLKKDKRFFEDVGMITSSRRHLNEPMYLSKDQIDKYRKLAYRAIRALIES